MDFSRSKKLARDEVFFLHESPPPLTYIEKGLIKFYILNSAGRERILFLGSEGQYISGLRHDKEDCRIYLQAKQDSHLVFFNDEEIEKKFGNGKIDPQFLNSLFQQMNFLVREIKSITFNNFPVRLAGLLVYLYEEFGKKELFFSHQEIADMLGVSRVTVTRVLGYFAEAGLINKKRKKIIINDIQGLKVRVEGGEDD